MNLESEQKECEIKWWTAISTICSLMFFGGQGEKAVAMVEVDILGSAIDKEGSVKITEMITKTLNENLGIAKDDMYIRYRASEDWGWNGTNF